MYVSIYVCVSLCTYMFVSIYFFGTYFYMYKILLFNSLSCSYLGCYLSVWCCYSNNILAFSFEFQNLIQPYGQKPVTNQFRLIYIAFSCFICQKLLVVFFNINE